MVTHGFIHIDLVFSCVNSTEKKMVASSQVKWVNTWWYVHLFIFFFFFFSNFILFLNFT